jgi:hypothetical protein
MKKAGAALIHVVIISLTVHVWHFVTSDRMLDAAADVGLDKITTISLRVAHIAGE